MKFRIYIQRTVQLENNSVGVLGIIEYGTATVNDMITIENNPDDTKYISDIKINGKSVKQAATGNKVAVVIQNCLLEELDNIRYILNAESLHNKSSDTWSNQWVNRYTTQQAEERKKEEAKLKLKNFFKRKSFND